ncbi:Type I restriction-modification system, DNA methylase subunit [Cnuella takakiae]|uniref:Type I restriction-modification system, DNA methylase subunit n=1 Tax=Cnuella takakiae TaxID=1302690 RepID=A0A1M4TC96_9BACT|nr:N-6 DNA methylase [Cnuella takakiae]OLY90707.1 hypothetical protein BUE76_01445 [Cnuella takakiae]SHE42005.1 Type I restriction-modification system, DNA methylase subunit [Cnuella takakiae]
MTLHEAIKHILVNFGPATPQEIADKLHEYNLYKRRDNELVAVSQVRTRVSKHPELFRVLPDGKVELMSLAFENLKNGLNKIADLLRQSRLGSDHLIEVLLPAFAITLKYGDVSILGYFHQDSLEAKEQRFVDQLIQLGQSQRFYGLFDTAIKAFQGIEHHVKNTIFELLYHSTLSPIYVINLRHEELSEEGYENQTSDYFSRYSIANIDEEDFRDFFLNLTNEFFWKRRFKNLGSTPAIVIKLAQALVQIKDNEVVFDPFTGKSTLLAQILRAGNNKDFQTVVGDIDPDAVLVSKYNFAVCGFRNVLVARKDAFCDWAEQGWFSDWFISNPPFLGSIIKRAHSYHFAGFGNDYYWLIIEMALAHIKPDGKACLILPDLLITSNAHKYVALRKRLISENLVDAIVHLPQGAFAPYSQVRTVLVILNRSRMRTARQEVFTYDGREETLEGFEKMISVIGAQYHLEQWRQHGNTINLAKVKAVGYTLDVAVLNAPVYTEEEGYRTVGDMLSVPVQKKETANRIRVYRPSKAHRPTVTDKGAIPLFNASDLQVEGVIGSKPPAKYAALCRELEPYLVPAGTILITTEGALLKPTVYNGPDPALISNPVIGLQPNVDKMLPHFLAYQLTRPYFTDQLNRIRNRAAKRNFRLEDFFSLKVMWVPLHQQKKLVDEILLNESLTNRDEASMLIGELKHKVKGPLGSIQSAVLRLEQYLKRKDESSEPVKLTDLAYRILPGQSEDQYQHFNLVNTISRINQSVKRVDEILRRTYDFTKIKKEALQMELIDLWEFLEKEVGPDYADKFTLNIQAFEGNRNAPRVWVDKHLLQSVFENFFDNAFVHGFQGKPSHKSMIRIFGITNHRNDPMEVFVFIENNGIATKELTTEKFIAKGFTSNAAKGGMGIGGAFIDKALKAMGGAFLAVEDISKEVGEFNMRFSFKLNAYEK